jgi:aminoglycoside phosphotransferase family enzyme/predicted kinase
MNSEGLREFLGDPRNYPHAADAFRHVETHISWVYLAGAHVYKIKKPVKFEFLDFSTLELREKACRKELRLNQRLAPTVYEQVVPLYEHDGHWSFDGDDVPAEFCVRMKRLPNDRMLDRMVREGAITAGELTPLVDVLAAFYRSAKTGERIGRGGTPASVESNVRANHKALRELHPESEHLDLIESAQLEFLGAHHEIFEDRVRQGKIVDGHGDLRAEHVCMLEPPVVFDCIEFNDRLRHVDIVDDVAFLAMDLDSLGRSDLAQALWSQLAERLGETEQQTLFDFYCSYRAAVRAKVDALREAQLPACQANHEGAKRRCLARLAQAAGYVRRFHRPRLLVTVGLMGCGKSTLAQALANALGMKHISSDAVRRSLFDGQGRTAAFHEGLYAPEMIDRVYAELFSLGREALHRGVSVILDATFLSQQKRLAALELAHAAGAPTLFLECRVPKGDAISRLDHRYRKSRSSSDGRPELYDEQSKCFEPLTELPPNSVLALNTSQRVDTLVAQVVDALSHRTNAVAQV